MFAGCRFVVRSVLYVGILFVAAGCAQYHHLVPPPPPTTDEGWRVGGTISLAFLPGDRTPIALQGGVYLGGSLSKGNAAAVGFGLNSWIVPTSFSFVFYDSLADNIYGTYALHLAHIFGATLEGGYTPSIETDAGVFLRSGDVRQSAQIGLAFMPDITGSYWSRWNVLSGSPRATFLPKVGYDFFTGPIVAGAAWYPGMTRYLLKSFRVPGESKDSSLVFAKDEIDSQMAGGNIHCWLGDIEFSLKSGETLRLMKCRDPFPKVLGMPSRTVLALNEITREDKIRAHRYWWVVVDTVIGSHGKTEARYERIMLLDTGAIMEGYRQTGALEIRDDPKGEHWLNETSIPVWRDMIFSIGGWLEREEKSK